MVTQQPMYQMRLKMLKLDSVLFHYHYFSIRGIEEQLCHINEKEVFGWQDQEQSMNVRIPCILSV